MASSLNLETILTFLTEHLLLVVGSVVVGYALYWLVTLPRNLPPGPRGRPFVGAVSEFQNGYQIHLDFCRLGEKYGDVFSMYVGNQLFVVFNSLETIKEAFLRDDFADHPTVFFYFEAAEIDGMLMVPYNEKYVKDRKFVMQALRTTGFGTRASEEKITGAIQTLQRHLEEKEGTSFTMDQHFFNKMTADIITNVLLSKNYGWDDPGLQEYIDIVSQFYDNFSIMMELDNLASILPRWLIRVLHRDKFTRVRELGQHERKLITDSIEEHKRTYTPGIVRDMLDYFIAAQDERGFNNTAFANLVLLILPDSISASAVVLHWIFFFITAHPEHQQTAQKQIDDVVGRSRQVQLSDKPELPFIDAIVTEVMRMAPPGPIGVAHCPSHDTTFRGYTIPQKNTQVYANFHAVHFNPKLFPEPETFNPTRFITGGRFNREAALPVMPFSIGRRMCPGEQMMKNVLFLTTASLLQRFRFRFQLQEGASPPKWDEFIDNFIPMHVPYHVTLTARN